MKISFDLQLVKHWDQPASQCHLYMTVAMFSFQADPLPNFTKVKTEASEIKQLSSEARPLGFGYQNTDSYFVLIGCFSRDLPPAAEGPCHSERSGRTAGMVFQKLPLSRRRHTEGEEPAGA